MTNKLILGTVQFGLDYGINNHEGKPSKFNVFQILDDAYTNGISTLDTADAYGNATEVLGEYLIQHPQSFLINTKFHHLDIPLKDQVDNSLRTLCIKEINTYFYHNFNLYHSNKESIQKLNSFKEKGIIKKIGVSVYDNHEFEATIADKSIDVIQFPFNMLDNFKQRGELMVKAKDKGKELHARSVFLQGLFFKSINTIDGKLSMLLPYLEEIHKVSSTYNINMEKLAIQYVIQQELIDYVIFGVDSTSQLENNILVLDHHLSDNIIEEINDINVKEVALLYPKNW
ncbi:MAG: aldo/keto reductase [Chitinophagales bacterium]|nr:aldo/keto reductase [Chitinophagales bacterium]